MNSNKHFQIRPGVMVGRARHILAFLCTVRSIMVMMMMMMMMMICLFDDNDDDVDSVLVFFRKHGNEGMD